MENLKKAKNGKRNANKLTAGCSQSWGFFLERVVGHFLREGKMNKIKVFCNRMFMNTIGIYIEQIEGNKAFLAKPLEFNEEPAQIYAQQAPTIEVKSDTAQQLMDQLWTCGVRPTEGTGSAGSLKATEAHLDDMRVIVFNKLGLGDKI